MPMTKDYFKNKAIDPSRRPRDESAHTILHCSVCSNFYDGLFVLTKYSYETLLKVWCQASTEGTPFLSSVICHLSSSDAAFLGVEYDGTD